MWNTSLPQRRASLKDSAPIGRIINSWNAIGASECEPPFTIFIIGTGRTFEFTPPRYWYRGRPSSSAAAFATASDTPSIALAPSFALLGVPSNSIIKLSIETWSKTFIPVTSGAIISFTLSTAFNTPFPMYILLSSSLSSTASYIPVDAPDGTDALPTTPDSKNTSTSIVGLPLESKICLAHTSSI